MGNDRPARLSDVQLKVSDKGMSSGKGAVHLKGLVMHSAISVQSIRIRNEGSTKHIDMIIGLTKPQQSGAFEIDVEVDEHTHRIVFGSDNSTVWHRQMVT